VDVHPNGTSHRVSLGVLNVAHRYGNEAPQAMKPGRVEEVSIQLDESGYCFLPGHRVRLAISTTYWPYLLPPPYTVTARIETGAGSILRLPILKQRRRIEMPAPVNPDPLPRYDQLSQPDSSRVVEHDLTGGMTRYKIHDDTGLSVHPKNQLEFQEIRRETWEIDPKNPLSLTARAHMTTIRGRGSWQTRTEVYQDLTVDSHSYHIKATLTGFEDGAEVLRRSWDESITRDFT